MPLKMLLGRLLYLLPEIPMGAAEMLMLPFKRLVIAV